MDEAFRVITTIGAAEWDDDGYDQLGRINPYAIKDPEKKKKILDAWDKQIREWQANYK